MKLLIAGLIAYMIYRIVFTQTAAPRAEISSGRSERGFAFLSNGLLFYRQRGRELKQARVYAPEAIDRANAAVAQHTARRSTPLGIWSGIGFAARLRAGVSGRLITVTRPLKGK